MKGFVIDFRCGVSLQRVPWFQDVDLRKGSEISGFGGCRGFRDSGPKRGKAEGSITTPQEARPADPQ